MRPSRSGLLLALVALSAFSCEDSTAPGSGAEPLTVAGTWTYTRTIETSDCGSVGNVDTTTLVIEQAGGVLTLRDLDGDLRGILSERSATLSRDGDGMTIELTFGADGSTFEGEGFVSCPIPEGRGAGATFTVAGEHISDMTTYDFAGYWSVDMRVETTTCGDDGLQRTVCWEIEQFDGTVTLVDRVGDLSGTFAGNHVRVSREDGSTLLISMVGTSDALTAEGVIVDGTGVECTRAISASATRQDGPCPLLPEDVLEDFVMAYKEKDIETYADLLDESFVFQAASDPDVPFDQLTYAQDVTTTGNMFEMVDAVELDIVHEGSQPSAVDAYPAERGYRAIHATFVLRIVTREIIGGEPLILLVPGDPVTFVFEPDSADAPSAWTIVYQRDEGSAAHGGNARTEDITWSVIKALYLDPPSID